MITINNGAFQDSAGNLVTGTLTLTLSADSQEAVTSPNGQVVAGTAISIAVTSGNAASTQVWSQAELSQPTYYTVELVDSNGRPVFKTPQIWVFTAATGQTVDLGIMRNSGPPTSPAYPIPPYPTVTVAAGTSVNLQAYVNPSGNPTNRTGRRAKHVGVMTSGSTTLTISSVVGGNDLFVVGDVGKRIFVEKAGANSGTLDATISAFVSSTQVTLSVACGNTVSIADCVWFSNTQRDDTGLANAQAQLTNSYGTLYASGDVYVLSATWNNVAALQSLKTDGANETWFVFVQTNSKGINWTNTPVWLNLGGNHSGATIVGNSYQVPATITGATLTGNVLTCTGASGLNFAAGVEVYVHGFRGNFSPINDTLWIVRSGATGTGFVADPSPPSHGSSFSHADIATAADVGTANLTYDGVYLESYNSNTSIVNRMTVSQLDIWGFAGDALRILCPNFGTIEQISATGCAGGINLQSIVPINGTFSDPSAAEIGGGCRLVGNYKYGLYSRFMAGFTVGMIGANTNGVNIYMYNPTGVVINSGDWENPTNRNAAWPGMGLTIRGAAGISVHSPLIQVGPVNDASMGMIEIIKSPAGKVLIDSPSFGAQSGFTQPTYEFQIDSTSTSIYIMNPKMINTNNWIDNNGSNKILLSNIDQNLVTFAGGITVSGTMSGNLSSGAAVTVSSTASANNDILTGLKVTSLTINTNSKTGVSVYAIHANSSGSYTGTPAITADLETNGTNTAGSTNYQIFAQGTNPSLYNGNVTVGGTATGNGDTHFHAKGALVATANNDILASIAALPSTVNVGVLTGTKIYGVRGVVNNASYTGTPAITADLEADGQCTAGTNNYSVYAPGTNPSLFSGGLVVGSAPTGGAQGAGTINAAGTYYANGTAGVTTGSITSLTAITAKNGLVTQLTGTSDTRLKISKKSKVGLREIEGLSPIEFHYNKLGKKHTGVKTNQKFVGFSAQDVQRQIPLAITGTEGPENYLSLDTRPILAACVNAIKELSRRLERLEKRKK